MVRRRTIFIPSLFSLLLFGLPRVEAQECCPKAENPPCESLQVADQKGCESGVNPTGELQQFLQGCVGAEVQIPGGATAPCGHAQAPCCSTGPRCCGAPCGCAMAPRRCAGAPGCRCAPVAACRGCAAVSSCRCAAGASCGCAAAPGCRCATPPCAFVAPPRCCGAAASRCCGSAARRCCGPASPRCCCAAPAGPCGCGGKQCASRLPSAGPCGCGGRACSKAAAPCCGTCAGRPCSAQKPDTVKIVPLRIILRDATGKVILEQTVCPKAAAQKGGRIELKLPKGPAGAATSAEDQTAPSGCESSSCCL